MRAVLVVHAKAEHFVVHGVGVVRMVVDDASIVVETGRLVISRR